MLVLNVSLEKSLPVKVLEILHDLWAFSELLGTNLEKSDGLARDLPLADHREFAETVNEFQEALFEQSEMVINCIV